MAEWIECGAAFIVADVVRWIEPAFVRPLTRCGRQRRTGKDVCAGEREVIAEVLSTPDRQGLVQLLVRGCRVVSAKGVQDVPLLRLAHEIRRQKKTLLKSKCGVHRLAWSDESARAVVAREVVVS